MRFVLFSAVLLASVGLLAGEVSAALGGSYEEGGAFPSLERYFECRQRCGESRLCARCESMARHEFGLSVQSSDPLRAAALFEEAIARDPTYVPPYFSFARLSLHLGLDGEGLFQRLKSLLAKAPRKKELLRLKARVDGVSRGR